MSKIIFNKLTNDAILPNMFDGDENCYNLYNVHDYFIKPGEIKKIFTDISFDVKIGFKARVIPSQVSFIMNSIEIQSGPIMKGFHGNIGLLVQKHGQYPFTFRRGDIIANLLIEKI